MDLISDLLFMPGFYLLINIGNDELWINILYGLLFALSGSKNTNKSALRTLNLYCQTSIFEYFPLR
jgi:hypothetical protein